jgi:transcriptional regulator with XRE-family HTH domain
MRQSHLRKRLAKFVKDKRGDEPLRIFAKRYGMSKDTVARIESQELNVTVDALNHMCKAFRCTIEELFPT